MSDDQILVAIITWILFSFGFAAAGRNKKIGYWECFAYCLLLSPLIGLIIGLTSSRKVVLNVCKYCGYPNAANIYYCVRCAKGRDGYTLEENKLRFQNVDQPLNSIQAAPMVNKSTNKYIIIGLLVLIIIIIMIGKLKH